MKITKKKPVKEAVKAKAKAVKQKVKGKIKGCAALVALAFAVVALSGCQTPNQASRGTSNENGDFEPSVDVKVNGSSNVVSIVIRNSYGDGAIASADSSGSTETQTQTPTFDISPKTDLRYNDALAAASTTSKGILETLTTTGMNKVLALMQSGGSGTVTVEKADGGQAVVTCENGQCTTCTDCGDPK